MLIFGIKGFIEIRVLLRLLPASENNFFSNIEKELGFNPKELMNNHVL